MECKQCKKKVSKKVEDFSIEKYKQVLCFKCQQVEPIKINEVPIKKILPIDRKQLLIIRQCCIKAAAEIASMRPIEWRELAEAMEAWVLR